MCRDMPLKTAGVRLLLKLSPQSCKVTSLIHERCTPNDAALAICNRVEAGLILVISLHRMLAVMLAVAVRALMGPAHMQGSCWLSLPVRTSSY